jgi:hypothetical protein
MFSPGPGWHDACLHTLRYAPTCDQAQVCEPLGLDPLYVANEGRFAAFAPEAEASRALEMLRAEPVASGAIVAIC